MVGKRALTAGQKAANAQRSRAYRKTKQNDPSYRAAQALRHKVSINF